MDRKTTALLAIVAFVCGAVSFLNARSAALNNQKAARGSSQPWLSDASPVAVELEENFAKELDRLRSTLVEQQKSLASALEDPCTSNEVVLEHTENVITAHEHMIRRVGEHLIELRGQLPAGNRDYLMGLCAEAARGPMRRLGGRAGGYGRQNGSGRGPEGRGYGYGRSGGTGRRGGGGNGLQLRARSRLARRLRLSEEQVKVLQEKDPDFETDSVHLRDALLAERAKLLSIFENDESSDDELLKQIQRLISTHSRIERRIAEHVLVLRPYLGVEQQKWLIGLCRQPGST